MEDIQPKLKACMKSLIEWSKQGKTENQYLSEQTMKEEEEHGERAFKSRLHALWKRE